MRALRLTAIALLFPFSIGAHADRAPPRTQILVKLGNAKPSEQASPRVLEYPPSFIKPVAEVPLAQVEDATDSSERNHYTTVENQPSSRFDIENSSDTLGIVVNFNGNELWNL